MVRVGLLFCLVASALAEYTGDDAVTVLTEANFKDLVLRSNELWMVEFYAPWCGHCKNLEPAWKKAADKSAGVARFGAVDATAHSSLAQKYGISGYPTIKVFGADKTDPDEYNGGRSVADLVRYAKSAADEMRNPQAKTAESATGADVVTLTEDNFEDLVLESDEPWMVEFYAPWCGHCKNLEPAWKKAAKKSDGVAKFGAVDATVHTSLAARYGVKGYPTIKVFGVDKADPIDYNAGRSVDDLVRAAADTAADVAAAKRGENVKRRTYTSSGGGGGGGCGGGGGGGSDEKLPYGADVVELTDDNFEDVTTSGKVVFVKFYAPWCGHCKNMVTALSGAASDLKGEAVVAAYDATKWKAAAAEHNVRGFPTLVVFYPDGTSEPYNGGREKEDIVAFLTDKLAEHGQGAEPKQITSRAMFDEECVNTKKRVCVIAALPHLIDGGKERRNRYLDLLKKAAAKHRYAFVWYGAGEQSGLDEAFGISVYPSLVATHFEKGMYGRFTQAFDEKHLMAFLKELTARSTIPKTFKVRDAAEWDGNDYVPPVEEDDEL